MIPVRFIHRANKVRGLVACGWMLGLAGIACAQGVKPAEKRTLDVFADASLREFVSAMERKYESEHPNFDVRITLGGAGQLANQIRAGAKFDVFLSSGPKAMYSVSGMVGRTRTFARNELVIVTGSDHAEIKRLPDLAMASQIFVANPSDPSYTYLNQVLERASQAYGRGWAALVQRKVLSDAQDVRQVVRNVGAGEVSVGVAYASDARVSRKVRPVKIVPGLNVPVSYSAASFAKGANSAAAETFLEMLLTPGAQADLKRRGFISPLEGVSELPVVSTTGTLRLFVGRMGTMAQGQVRVRDNGKWSTYRGTDLRSILSTAQGNRIRFTGGDGQSVDVSLGEIRKTGAVLVTMTPGNVQVVLPQRSRALWVRWLRKIEIL